MAAACDPIATAEVPASDARERRWTPFRTALFLTIGLRVLYGAVAALVAPFLVLDPARISAAFTEDLIQRGPHPWLYAFAGVWQRFDTLLYIYVARHGYNGQWITVMYPLYPALIRVCSLLTRSDLASALLLATISAFFLIWGALVLLELDYTPRVAVRSVVLWVMWPTAFILLSGYAEPMLLALTVWSIYFARKANWTAAGATAFLAGLSKALGCFVALPLIYLGWKQRNWRSVLAAAAAGLGTAGFQIWLKMAGFPSPAEIYAQNWHVQTVMPWVTLIEGVRLLISHYDILTFLNLVVLVFAAALCFARRVPLEYRIYAIGALLLFLTKRATPLLQGNMRYSFCMFAAFPALAKRLEDDFYFVGATAFLGFVNLLLFREFLDWNLVV